MINKNRTTRINFCLPIVLYKKLKYLSDKSGLTIADILRRAIDNLLKEMKDSLKGMEE